MNKKICNLLVGVIIILLFTGCTNSTPVKTENEVSTNYLDEYSIDTEYLIDLNKDEQPDKIVYSNNGNIVSMTINEKIYELNVVAELTYYKFKIIDLDKNDSSIEIVLSEEAPPMDEYLNLFRYDGENLYSLGSVLGGFEDIGKGIIFEGNNEINVSTNSYIMQDGIFNKKHTIKEEVIVEILPEDLYNYVTPIKSKINEETNAYYDKSIEEYIEIAVGEEIVIYGEVENWLNIKWGDKELWINGEELDHSRVDGIFQFDGIKFWS